MVRSFRGGVHPEAEKLSARRPIEQVQASNFVTIPLSQYAGAKATALVKPGDRVFKGQKIAESGEGYTLPVHASISGTVTAIEKAETAGGEREAVTIENDFKETLCPTVKPYSTTIAKADPEELAAYIREKGIVGMGGAAFPTWAKIRSAAGKVEKILINCVESEPYLTAIRRLLVERGEEVVGGAKILLRATGAKKAVFAMERGKKDAAEAIFMAIGEDGRFDLERVRDQYPQGDERHLVYALTRKEIPKDALAEDLGVVVFNAETCWAVYRAFVTGLPAIQRLLTVSGDCVKTPSNFLVPIGVSFRDLFARCGGFSQKPDQILVGGPMMGKAQRSLDLPVTKETGGLIAMTAPTYVTSSCIRCGRCVRACPMHLMPLEFFRLVRENRIREAETVYGIQSCSECGCCSFVCPAHIPLLQGIRKGKQALNEEKEG